VPQVAAALLLTHSLFAQPIVLHLKSGDRISGNLVAQNEEHLVVGTSWAGSLSIPVSQVESAEGLNADDGSTLATHPEPSRAPEGADASLTTKAKAPKEWKFNAKLGADMIRGERDRDIYYSQFALTYAHPYETDPKKFLRNNLDCRLDYGTTDGQKSANRMYASDKTDFDITRRTYGYNNVGGGYDEVRRITSEIEAGPGVGFHVVKHPNFAANVEGGLTYQDQSREEDVDLESVYARFGQDFDWYIYSRITLTQRSSLLASLEDSRQLQFRLEANLAFGIVQNLSLNLTAVELYDTRPVPGVTESEFQLRSSLGITF